MDIDKIKNSSKYIFDSLNVYDLKDIEDGMLKTYLFHTQQVLQTKLQKN